MANSWPKPKPGVPVAIAILEDVFPAINVSDEAPDPRAASYIIVSALPGAYNNPAFTEPRILVECWASDSSTAEDMACTGIQAFKNATGKSFLGSFIHGCQDIQGPTDYNDPDIQDRRRCQFHATLRVSTD
jgi:hypothetical protein